MKVSGRKKQSRRGTGTAAAAAAAAAAARAPSPVPSSAAAAAAGRNKRKGPPPAAAPSPQRTTTDNAPARAQAPSKKSKVANDPAMIKKEVREILEKKLIGPNVEARLDALRTLNKYWQYDPNKSVEENKKCNKTYRQATIEGNACFLVLIVLRQELDKGEGVARANRRVVHETIRFLNGWNCFEPELGDTMLRFDGVEAVARAMTSFRQDKYIQYLAVVCLYDFTNKGGEDRLHKVVEAGCLPLILHALPSLSVHVNGPYCAVLSLGRLCEVAAPHHFEGLVDDAVLKWLVQVYKGSDADVCDACRAVMNKLLA